MWTREQLKTSAKDVLRRNYWMPFLASLLYNVMLSVTGSGSGASMPSFSWHFKAEDFQKPEAQNFLDSILANVEKNELLSLLALTGIAAVIIWILAMVIAYAIHFFVTGPLRVGYARFYMVNREREARIDTLFHAFKKNYLKAAAAQFTTTLFISLWNLLIIPGIIFSYKWYQVPYILAENPSLTGKRAREISDAMTDGEKWEMFVLGLSFIGWTLLGALACGVGILFVEPYVQATYAELYARQRQKVLEEGLATAEELPGL